MKLTSDALMLLARRTYRITRRSDGVAVIWIDAPGRRHNLFDAAFAAALRRACDEVDADSTVRGVVLASGKANSFMVGSDLAEVECCETTAEARLISQNAQRVVAWLESLKKPVVAAVHGACFDAGLELVLACDTCVCSDATSTLLGAREIRLGLMPFAGGTGRLARRVGPRRALDMLLTGRAWHAGEAQSAGLVERVVPAAALVDSAARHALALSTGEANWTPARQLGTLFSIKSSLGRTLWFARARRAALARHRANHVAPCRIIDALQVGLDKGFEAGLSAEARAFGELAVGYAARQLIAFERARAQLALRGSNDSAAPFEVVTDSSIRRLDAKRATLRSVERATRPGTVFATETAGLSLAEIAEASLRPKSVVGVHFASLDRGPLLEVITTSRTEARALAACVEFGKRQEKTVVVVRDAPGPYTLRVMAPCVLEALQLVSEGASPAQVDRALQHFGFYIGPLEFLDATGLDVFSRLAATLSEALGSRMSAPPLLDALLADGRCGRACGRGVYRYDGERRRAGTRLGRRLGLARPSRPPSARDIIGRSVLRFVNEAVLCWSDGVLQSVRDGDIAAVLGAGFPAFRGGPFSWVDTFGASGVVERLVRYRSTLGMRFEPAPALVEMMALGARFSSADPFALHMPGPGVVKAASSPLQARAIGS